MANLDIGGGTTNICFFENGHMLDTACLDIGGRLVQIQDGRLTYVAPKIQWLADKLELDIREGKQAEERELRILTDAMADIRDKYEIPTRTCVLSHVTTQMEALRSGQGSADLYFQSIAGSKVALSAFGVTTSMLEEADALFKDRGHAKGPNVMYFETGQGSDFSSSAAFGANQQTMECRYYGLARHYHPFLSNTVVGFMETEYIYNTKQRPDDAEF